VSLPWPEMQSSARPSETVRQMLDYICWIAQDLQLLGAHGPGEVATWRRQVGIAYRALVNPMIPGYGDPYPPDVPPARSPGLWPDVAAHDIPGMTVRHQLVVVGMLADQSRGGAGVRARPELLQDLEMRIARARTALDHGPGRPLPAAARTEPSKALIAAANAEEKAIREHARRHTRQVRKLLRSVTARPKPAHAGTPAAPPSKATPSNATPSNTTPSKAMPSNTTPSKAMPSKASAAKAAPRKAAPRKAAPRKAAPRKAAPTTAKRTAAAKPKGAKSAPRSGAKRNAGGRRR